MNTPEQPVTDSHDSRLELHTCAHDVPQTVGRIKAALERRNVPIFAEFDHQRNARDAGLELRPTKVIVFGAPAVGTKVMQKNQSICIELPLRIAVWQDARQNTWLAFPRLERLAEEYNLEDDPVLAVMKKLLQALAQEAGAD